MNSNTAITREEIMLFLNRRNCNLPLYKGMKEKFNLKTDQSVFNILHYTHTQCVLHIIRLRLIIFHTPNFLKWRFSL